MKIVLKVLGAIFAVAVCCAVIATSIINSNYAKDANERVDKYTKKMEEIQKALDNEKKVSADGDNENILIADRYQIKDTSKISNAYIAGNEDGLDDTEKATLKAAKGVLDEIIKDDMTLFEKEKAVYEWIVVNVEHDDGKPASEVDNPLGVITGKKAVCVGYATTFRLLVNMLGIECKVMHSTELGHSWDICKLDDDCWYITDCYFDAGYKKATYAGFNMTSTQAADGHDWDASLFPKAKGTKYSYAIMNAKKIDDPTKMIGSLKKRIKKNKDGFIYASYEVSTDDVQKAMKADYIFSGFNDRTLSEDANVSFENKSFKVGNKKYYIINSTRYEEEEQNNEPAYDFDTEKIDKELNEKFGEANEDYVGF